MQKRRVLYVRMQVLRQPAVRSQYLGAVIRLVLRSLVIHTYGDGRAIPRQESASHLSPSHDVDDFRSRVSHLFSHAVESP